MTEVRSWALTGPRNVSRHLGRSPLHHPSHRALLTPLPNDDEPATLDAIVVPTARPPDFLAEALRVAHELDCTLLTLCSQDADPHATAAEARRLGVDAIAVDVRDTPR